MTGERVMPGSLGLGAVPLVDLLAAVEDEAIALVHGSNRDLDLSCDHLSRKTLSKTAPLLIIPKTSPPPTEVTRTALRPLMWRRRLVKASRSTWLKAESTPPSWYCTPLLKMDRKPSTLN